eukprot:658123-Rhodomonas_salina.5
MSDTDLGYAATSGVPYASSLLPLRYATRYAPLPPTRVLRDVRYRHMAYAVICVRACDAMPGTDTTETRSCKPQLAVASGFGLIELEYSVDSEEAEFQRIRGMVMIGVVSGSDQRASVLMDQQQIQQ